VKFGQISVFAAIGAILVIGALVAIVAITTSESSFTADQIPENFLPVRVYLESCLAQTSTNALYLAGAQGGFVDPSRFNIIGSHDLATESDGLKFSTNSPTTVPYWFYLKANNRCDGNCFFGSLTPPLSGDDPASVESQISYYVANELNNCLDYFEPLSEQGYSVSAQDLPFVRTIIRDADVRVELTYPLQVSIGDEIVQMRNSYVTLDVPFKQMHEYAIAITANQIQHRFLEKQLLALISIYGGLDTDRLPPISASTYDYVPTLFWLKSDVKLKIQEIIQTYVGMFQIVNSKNFAPINTPSAGTSTASVAQVFKDSSLPIGTNLPYNSQMEVYFDYIGLPYYFDVNSDGEVIRPFSLSVPDFPFFGYQEYMTLYDISYPVLVRVENADAFGGKGFTYSFGLESNIRLNSPMQENFTIIGNTITPDQGLQTLVCEYTQRNTGQSSIRVTDAVTQQPLASAPLQFICGDDVCSVGVTNAQGVFSGKLPVCGGGLLRVSAQDYLDSVTLLNTASGVSSDATVSMQPLKELQASVAKKMIEKNTQGWSYTGRIAQLLPNEMAIVSYEQVNPAFGQDPISGAFVYYSNEGPSDLTTVKLAPGQYKVTTTTMLLDSVIIPEEVRTKKVLFKKIRFTIPEIAFDQYPSGDYTFDENTFFVDVTANDLRQNAIVFYTLGSDLPAVPVNQRKVEDLGAIQDIRDTGATFAQSLLPRFVDSSELPRGLGGSDAAFMAVSKSQLSPSESFEVRLTLLTDKPVSSIIASLGSTQRTITGIAMYAPISFSAPNSIGSHVVSLEIIYADGTKQILSQSIQVGTLSVANGVEVVVANQATTQINLNVGQTKDWSILATYLGGDAIDITASVPLELGDDTIADYTTANISGLKAGRTEVRITYGEFDIAIPIIVTQG